MPQEGIAAAKLHLLARDRKMFKLVQRARLEKKTGEMGARSFVPPMPAAQHRDRPATLVHVWCEWKAKRSPNSPPIHSQYTQLIKSNREAIR